ncbi:MAG: transcription termination/antitermination factor NusG [Planctomycetaceae bacterium]|jgi:transcription termination/antitermination protein NusG|nr:transcription termination/antitermination factor NusG [Planctomycetaceae bacterium]
MSGYYVFGVFTVNEFQDESNESLEPQDNSTPASNDNISQDSAPEEVGNEVQQDAPVETTESIETPAEPVADEAVTDASSEEVPAEDESDVEESEEAPAEDESDVEESEEAPAEELVVEPASEPTPAEESAEEESEDAPFDPHNIPKKYDSQTLEWYILKVQVNRETTIRDALLRRIKMEGLDDYFEEVIVPTEDIVEFTRSGKRKVVKRKLYPGYIMVKMMLQDDSWFLVRETPGIGDFTGTFGKPTPMPAHEVERILSVAQPEEDSKGEEPQLKTAIPFNAGDRVRVKDGNFQNFEGEVDGIDEANGRVTLIINIFGRSTPVELEHWQIEEI